MKAHPRRGVLYFYLFFLVSDRMRIVALLRMMAMLCSRSVFIVASQQFSSYII